MVEYLAPQAPIVASVSHIPNHTAGMQYKPGQMQFRFQQYKPKTHIGEDNPTRLHEGLLGSAALKPKIVALWDRLYAHLHSLAGHGGLAEGWTQSPPAF